MYYQDCLDAFLDSNTADGVYHIHPVGGTPTTAWCDMTNGGWTVIQRRMDGSEDFERLWAEYAAGFGSRSGEYWLGLENMHYLTIQPSSLVIELETFPGTDPLTSVETYSNFSIGDSSTNYTLHVSGFEPSAQDCNVYTPSGHFAQVQNGLEFSTADHETVFYAGSWCSWNTRSGWWHDAICFPYSLNGFYHQVGYTPLNGFYYENIAWYTCWDYTLPLMKTKMRVKRR